MARTIKDQVAAADPLLHDDEQPDYVPVYRDNGILGLDGTVKLARFAYENAPVLSPGTPNIVVAAHDGVGQVWVPISQLMTALDAATFVDQIMLRLGTEVAAVDGASLHFRIPTEGHPRAYDFFAPLGLAFVTAEEVFERDDTNDDSKVITLEAVKEAETPTPVTYAASLTIDLDTGQDFIVAVTGNMTVNMFTNLRAWKSGLITFTYNGAHTTAFAGGDLANFLGGDAVDFPTGSGARITMGYRCISTTQVEIGTFVRIEP